MSVAEIREFVDEEPAGLGLADYLVILRRRIWYMILPAIAIFSVAAVVAVLLPATYRSTATILIEQQQIPQDLVRSTVTSYADQRIQIISQRVMTTANLTKIVEDYKLYRAERQEQPMSALVASMRDDIELKMVSADVVDPRSGGSKKAAIAFTLSFDHKSPIAAQKVTNELVSLFLNENLRKRQEAAEETSAFLQAEAERLAQQIGDLEAKFAQFKQQHGENLPEMQQVNAQFMQRTEDEIDRSELEEALLAQRITALQGELGRTDRYALGSTGGNGAVLSPKQRLAELELQRLLLAARLKENHPDLVYLQREIDTLRQETGGLGVAELEKLLTQARATLAERRQALADRHPDVRAAEASVASLEQQLSRARAGNTEMSPTVGAENPVYLSLQTELESARSQLDFLRKKRDALREDLTAYEDRLKEAPKIEREYRALTRDYDNAVAKYKEIKAKEMEAELAESLETERKAERFVLIEPAIVPNKPIKPNRLAIVFLGFVFSLGGGVGTVVLREAAGQALYGGKSVAAVTGAPPLAVIPYIETAREARLKRRKRWVAGAMAVILLIGSLAAVHVLFRPLDIVAYQVLQRFGLVQ